MSPPDLSIITISHDHLPVLGSCLTSLYAHSGHVVFETLVIDNTGSAEVMEWTRAHRPEVRVLRNPVRKGFAANVNTGLQALDGGRYFLLLNPDVICLPGLLDRMVVFMDCNPDVAIAAPQLFNPDGTRQPNCRSFPTPRVLALRALHLDTLRAHSPSIRQYLMSDAGSPQPEVDWVTGALAIVRRTAVKQVGMMDERYFLYWEDMDWCYRMWQRGWKVCRVGEAAAVHFHRRQGVRRPFSRAGREQIAGAVRFFRKFGCSPVRISVASRRPAMSRLNRLLKRAIDLAAGSLLGLASLPVMVLAAALIKIISPGPALYRQIREGEGGVAISITKLRSMYPDAESQLVRHLEDSPAAQSEWRRCYKLKQDPRVLPGIGKFLRRTSLDELPQIWSVLKGDMSLVGPRPLPAYHLHQFDQDFRALRSRVPPGLTGLWQVTTRSEGDLQQQRDLDTYYIYNWSIWMDLRIIVRTAWTMLFPHGAY